MELIDVWKACMAEEHLTCYAALPLAECRVIRPYLLARDGIGETGTVCIFAVPYFTRDGETPERNVSSYAVARDYHLFFRQLYEKWLPRLRAAFPAYHFGAYADHSPLDEVDAAAKGGLGVIGRNRLLLTKAYSSFVFLGEMITDAEVPCQISPPQYCEACGACRTACPVDSEEREGCLSALTQKKGLLTEAEKQQIKAHGCVWGCDRCQMVCPYTVRAREAGTLYSPVPFFGEACLPHLTYEDVAAMSDAAFSERAYAWRGRETILRNLDLMRS